MQLSKLVKYTIIMSFMFFSCEEPLTNSEKKMIDKLNEEFSGKYRFETLNSFGAFYLKIYTVDQLNDNDIISIHKENILNKYPEIRWSYINVYNNKNKFLYQLTYDTFDEKYYKNFREYK